MATEVEGEAGLRPSLVVGRDAELDQIQTVLAEVGEGESRVVVLIGEAGMGKTTLAQEAAAAARRSGFLVARGRAWEDVDTPPYWVWTQVLQELDDVTRGGLESLLPAESRRVLQPFLPDRVAPATPIAADDKAESRLLLFQMVERLLYAVAGIQPLLLMIDDLHAVDESSLLLLRFLAQQRMHCPVMIVATYDDRQARDRPAHAASLGNIAREVVNIRVRPLDADAVKALYVRVAGEEPSDAIAVALTEMTEGNPFFVEEAARLMMAKGDIRRPDHSTGFRVPEGARGIIRARLGVLPEASTELLRVASVLGREFDVSILQSVADLELDALLDLLDPPLQADVLEEAGLGRYRFTHTLLRETIYEDVSAGQRMRLHRRVAEVLEDSQLGDPLAHVAELAHHWFKAAQAGDFAKTVSYAVSAARKATEGQAFEEAARLYRRALKAAHSAGLSAAEKDELRSSLSKVQNEDADPIADVTETALQQSYTFQREGDVWLIEYQGRTSRLRGSRGMQFIAHLLANPGREIHAIELSQLIGGRQTGSAGARIEAAYVTPTAFADAGEILDATAKEQYRRRISELTEEADEADSYNDPERAARARQEIDLLLAQLSSALGLAGRDRRAAAPAERARVNVTKTIKEALRRIEEADPQLGKHLQVAIRTGTFCAYLPDPGRSIHWST